MSSPGLSIREKLSYGLGDLASNLCWNMLSGFLLFFYINVALIPVAAVGTLMLLSRVLDALIDPAIGVLVDRTHTRHGKARPYLLYGAIPFGLIFGALFLVPFSGSTAKLLYAYATLILVGIVYSAVSIPYSSLMPLMTRSTDQKVQMSSLRTIGSAIGTFIVTASTMPIVNRFGTDKRMGFAVAGGLFAGVATVLFLVVFANCKERYQDHSVDGSFSLGGDVKNMFRNRPWLVTFAFAMLMLMRLGAMIAATIYFTLDVVKQPWMISFLLPMISVTYALSAMVARPYLKRFGLRNGCIFALVGGAIFFAALPLVEGRTIPFLVLYSLSSFCMGICPTATWTMQSDSIDYQQWLFGRRSDGLLVSAVSFATKVGMAAGASFIAYALAWAHFNPEVMTPATVSAVRWLYYLPPVVLMGLQILVIAFYNLDRLHPRIVADLAARSVLAVNQQALDEAGLARSPSKHGVPQFPGADK